MVPASTTERTEYRGRGAMMKNAMRVAGEKFTARRMVEEYVEKYYVPSMNGDGTPDDPPTA